MLFKDGPEGRLAKEVHEQVHPDLRGLLCEIDFFCRDIELPAVMVTHAVRKLDEHVAIYVPYWKRLISMLENGEKLSHAEAKLAVEYHKKSVEELEALAARRWSWHMCHCAVDLRTRHWTPTQLLQVVAFAETKTADRRKWEFLVHDVTAAHMHLAVRDFDYRSRLDPRKGTV